MCTWFDSGDGAYWAEIEKRVYLWVFQEIMPIREGGDGEAQKGLWRFSIHAPNYPMTISSFAFFNAADAKKAAEQEVVDQGLATPPPFWFLN